MPRSAFNIEHMNVPVDVLIALVRHPDEFEKRVKEYKAAERAAIKMREDTQKLIDETNIRQRDALEKENSLNCREKSINTQWTEHRRRMEGDERELNELRKKIEKQASALADSKRVLDERDCEQNARSEELDRREREIAKKEEQLALDLGALQIEKESLRMEQTQFRMRADKLRSVLGDP